MDMRILIVLLAVGGLVAGCEQFNNMSTGQKGAVTGAALGTGIGRQFRPGRRRRPDRRCRRLHWRQRHRRQV